MIFSEIGPYEVVTNKLQNYFILTFSISLFSGLQFSNTSALHLELFAGSEYITCERFSLPGKIRPEWWKWEVCL